MLRMIQAAAEKAIRESQPASALQILVERSIAEERSDRAAVATAAAARQQGSHTRKGKAFAGSFKKRPPGQREPEKRRVGARQSSEC